MLMRRVERRMGLLQLVDRREYLQVLREQPQELQSAVPRFSDRCNAVLPRA